MLNASPNHPEILTPIYGTLQVIFSNLRINRIFKITRFTFFFTLILHFFNCQNSPLSNIHDAGNAKVTFAFVSQLGPRSATLSWECSSSLPGSVLYGKGAIESVVTSLENSKIHSMILPNLESNTDYLVYVFCSSDLNKLQGIPLTFKTWISDFPKQDSWSLGCGWNRRGRFSRFRD
ncbi:hypothetical protein LEP1GSC062_1597 [Leptospira alexanderi serovar Manhao 3 str. L 60]|uniref:Fibronectin type-III domain-containing protein n=1 Tax=Leptospira alexanderi serovar Manhao 3 str. L 60 TaxID=1049759 RepID=V6HUY5_9LEPT|nr:hypothetical protein LEP1GSC062_1597 [Leptospira alexanderi serovar Manhao 3 str. L 60]